MKSFGSWRCSIRDLGDLHCWENTDDGIIISYLPESIAMKVEATNPRTGDRVSTRISDLQAEKLRELGQVRTEERRLHRFIEGLDLSADSKAVIKELSDVAVELGGQSIKVGRRVVEIAVALQVQFPRATFGLIVGLVVSILITAIPVLGSIIGGFVTPIAVLVGIGIGFTADVQDSTLYRKITEAAEKFDPLKPSIKSAKQAYDQLLSNLSLQTS